SQTDAISHWSSSSSCGCERERPVAFGQHEVRSTLRIDGYVLTWGSVEPAAETFMSAPRCAEWSVLGRDGDRESAVGPAHVERRRWLPRIRRRGRWLGRATAANGRGRVWLSRWAHVGFV